MKIRPIANAVVCTNCGGSSPVSREHCPTCGYSGVEPCFYKFDGCTGTAVEMVDGYGSCAECVLFAERDALMDLDVAADTERAPVAARAS